MPLSSEKRDDMLIEMHGLVKSMVGIVDRHDKTLYGNGKPGLAEDVKGLKDAEENRKEDKSQRNSLVALWFAGFSSAATVGMLIYMCFQ